MASSAPKVGHLVRLWHEMPEIVGSSFMALIGLGFSAQAVWLYYKNDGAPKKYRYEYTVWRPDDPRVPTIKKHCGLDN